MRARPGFTLIEAMVALVLFEIAALALVAMSITAARDLATADGHARAYAMAVDRVARLRGGACAATTAGNVVHAGGLREQWRVEAVGSARLIVDSVSIPAPRGREGAVTVRGWEVCGG